MLFLYKLVIKCIYCNALRAQKSALLQRFLLPLYIYALMHMYMHMVDSVCSGAYYACTRHSCSMTRSASRSLAHRSPFAARCSLESNDECAIIKIGQLMKLHLSAMVVVQHIYGIHK